MTTVTIHHENKHEWFYLRAESGASKYKRQLFFKVKTNNVQTAYDTVKKLLPSAKFLC